MKQNENAGLRPVGLVCVCGRCGGSGVVVVTGVYLETYLTAKKLLESGKVAHIVANRDSKHFGCKPTALSNRLKWLHHQGALRAEKYGRQQRYSMVPDAAESQREPVGALSSDAMRFVRCPWCGSDPGISCTSPTGARTGTHASRIAALASYRPDIARQSKRAIK